MQLFHHIVAFRLNEEEKKAFLEVGVEFARTVKASRGENVAFEIGEDDPRYERIGALLISLGPERVRDTSMTVPTLTELISKMVANGGERLRQEAAMRAQWKRGGEAFRHSMELFKSGKKEEARDILDPVITEAIQENHSSWVVHLCRHAALLSRLIGDRKGQIHYEEKALPFVTDYKFAAYNFAQLLLADGQLVRAEHYAGEAYKQSITQATDNDRDLLAAILRQWPNVAQTM